MGDIDGSAYFSRGGKGGKGKRKSGEIDQLAIMAMTFMAGKLTRAMPCSLGIELDDETLQSRKMVDEVSIMDQGKSGKCRDSG